MRVDPQARPMVVVDGMTNYVGLVDLVVKLGDKLGDGSWHAPPYNEAACPYNYGDVMSLTWPSSTPAQFKRVMVGKTVFCLI